MTWWVSYGLEGSSGAIEARASLLRVGSSTGSAKGGSSILLDGRKEMRRRTSARQSSSPSTAKWATPLLVEWTWAPPNSSWVTSSWVTARITSGPVIYIWLVPWVMKTK